jgi:hypothetical protein
MMRTDHHDKLMSNFFAQTEHCCMANLLLWFKLNFKQGISQEEAKFLLPFKVLRVTNQNTILSIH